MCEKIEELELSVMKAELAILKQQEELLKAQVRRTDAETANIVKVTGKD